MSLHALRSICVSIFTALLLAAAVTWTTPAVAHQQSWDFVDGSEMRYIDSTQWDDARNHAIGVWNDLGRINIAPDDFWSVADVTFVDYTANDGNCGLTSPAAEEIRFNNNAFNINTVGKNRSCATHEVGHALGLDHSYIDQVMDPCPVCPNPQYYAYPQSHDRDDYHERWG